MVKLREHAAYVLLQPLQCCISLHSANCSPSLSTHTVSLAKHFASSVIACASFTTSIERRSAGTPSARSTRPTAAGLHQKRPVSVQTGSHRSTINSSHLCQHGVQRQRAESGAGAHAQVRPLPESQPAVLSEHCSKKSTTFDFAAMKPPCLSVTRHGSVYISTGDISSVFCIV